MKYLQLQQFVNVSTLLTDFDLGDRVINGRIEGYSCKRTGTDKRLSKEIEKQLNNELKSLGLVSPSSSCSSSSSLASSYTNQQHRGRSSSLSSSCSSSSTGDSPLGPLNSSTTRRLLCDLISTLNSSYPDYDFSNLRPDQFTHESNANIVCNAINTGFLNDVDSREVGFRDDFWTTLDSFIKLQECSIYSYIPEADSDVFGIGKLWSFNYFFFNKKRKQIAFLTANACSKLHKNRNYFDSAKNAEGDLDYGYDDFDDFDDFENDVYEAHVSNLPTKNLDYAGGVVDCDLIDFEELGVSKPKPNSSMWMAEVQAPVERLGSSSTSGDAGSESRTRTRTYSQFGSLQSFGYASPPIRPASQPLHAHKGKTPAAMPELSLDGPSSAVAAKSFPSRATRIHSSPASAAERIP